MGEAERGVAFALHVAGACHPRRHLPAAFGRRRQDEIGGGHRRHFDVQVDPVQQRAGQPRLIFGGTAGIRTAAAGEAGIIRAPATAGIHSAISMKRDG